MINLDLISKKIRRRIIFISKRGSHTFGTNTVNSDNDYIVIYIPTKEQMLGFKYPNYKIKNYQHEVGDNDIVVYSNIYFTEQLHGGNPNFMDTLFLRDEDILYINKKFFPYIERKELFLTQKYYYRTTGMVRRFIHEIEEGEFVKRKEFKCAMHALRNINMCAEILNDYRIATTYRNDNWYLKRILNGDFSKESMLEVLEASMKVLDISFKSTLLPEKPNINYIHNTLVGINFEAIHEREIFTGLKSGSKSNNYYDGN